MVSLPVQRQARLLLPDLSDWFSGFPSWAGLRPLSDSHLIRLEDEIADGRYVVRAELPGIDPTKDVDITVRDDQLTIKAQRSEKKEFDGRSEFSAWRSYVSAQQVGEQAHKRIVAGHRPDPATLNTDERFRSRRDVLRRLPESADRLTRRSFHAVTVS